MTGHGDPAHSHQSWLFAPPLDMPLSLHLKNGRFGSIRPRGLPAAPPYATVVPFGPGSTWQSISPLPRGTACSPLTAGGYGGGDQPGRHQGQRHLRSPPRRARLRDQVRPRHRRSGRSSRLRAEGQPFARSPQYPTSHTCISSFGQWWTAPAPERPVTPTWRRSIRRGRSTRGSSDSNPTSPFRGSRYRWPWGSRASIACRSSCPLRVGDHAARADVRADDRGRARDDRPAARSPSPGSRPRAVLSPFDVLGRGRGHPGRTDSRELRSSPRASSRAGPVPCPASPRPRPSRWPPREWCARRPSPPSRSRCRGRSRCAG